MPIIYKIPISNNMEKINRIISAWKPTQKITGNGCWDSWNCGCFSDPNNFIRRGTLCHFYRNNPPFYRDDCPIFRSEGKISKL